MTKYLTTLSLMLLSATVLAAPGDVNLAARVLARTPGLITLTDDDGGRVEVFRHEAPQRSLTYHGGPIIKDPVVELIFAGDWTTPAAAARRAELLRAAAEISASESFQALSPYGIRTSGLLLSNRELPAFGRLNDLSIQSHLDAGMTNGSLPLRDENVIHLVFLASGLDSVLRDHTPGADYHSYHSHVQLQDVNVRYVVVPYDQDGSRMAAAARGSLFNAIVNPDGDGWY